MRAVLAHFLLELLGQCLGLGLIAGHLGLFHCCRCLVTACLAYLVEMSLCILEAVLSAICPDGFLCPCDGLFVVCIYCRIYTLCSFSHWTLLSWLLGVTLFPVPPQCPLLCLRSSATLASNWLAVFLSHSE